MKTNKRLTNDKLLINFVKKADPVFLAFAVATLVSDAEKILKNEAQVREDYKNSMIHPNLIITNAKTVIEFLEQK